MGSEATRHAIKLTGVGLCSSFNGVYDGFTRTGFSTYGILESWMALSYISAFASRRPIIMKNVIFQNQFDNTQNGQMRVYFSWFWKM